MRKNCDRINAVKTVTVFKTLGRHKTTVFLKRYGNFILTPTVYKNVALRLFYDI